MFEKIKENEYNNFRYKYGPSVKVTEFPCVKYFVSKADITAYGKSDPAINYIQFTDDKSIYIMVNSDYLDFALKYIELFGNDLFSHKAIDFMFDIIKKNMRNFQIMPPNSYLKYDYAVTYGINDISKLNLSKKQDTTIPFYSNTKYEIVEKYVTLDKLIIYYGTLINNKIVSIGGCNNYCHPDRHPHVKVSTIATGTHENYRQKGYALSNVVAMAEYLLKKGKEVSYLTNSKNTGSQKTALSAGFTEVARENIYFIKI